MRRAAWHETLLKNGSHDSNAAKPLLQRDGSVLECIKRRRAFADQKPEPLIRLCVRISSDQLTRTLEELGGVGDHALWLQLRGVTVRVPVSRRFSDGVVEQMSKPLLKRQVCENSSHDVSAYVTLGTSTIF